MATTSTTDVLIVGAGPTGTTLAIDLTRRGIRVRLIDKEPHAFNGSRAKGIQPRTLEVLEDLGAVAAILDGGILYPKMGIHVGPATIPKRMIEKGDPSPDIPYPDTWLIPQNTTIRILHDRLESLGTRIELGTELLDFTTTGTGVVARLKGDDGIEEITASFLVGADGASSHVRKGAGIDFEGTTDDADRMLIVDAVVDGGLSRKYWHVWPGPGGFAGACPLPHSELFQWMIKLDPNETPPSTAAEITYAVRSRTGNKKLALRDIAWQSVFRPNIRLASHYRRGPVLVAGDAAHVHTPAGAQGLNTGIGDAYNLGWKLGQVLAGAPDALLDSYETERQPIAAAVLGLSTKKYQGMAKLDPKSAKRGKEEKQLLLTYRGGPLTASSGDETTTLAAGDRAPDAHLVSATGTRVRLFDEFAGPHFTAIAYGSTAADVLHVLPWPNVGASLKRLSINGSGTDGEEVFADPHGDFARIYGLRHDTLLIIRPDGYIASIATNDMLPDTTAAIAGSTPAHSQ